MKRRHIATVIVLLLGAAALTALEWRNASTEITPRPLLYLVADAQREAERLPLTLTRVSVEEENRIGRELAARYSLPPPSSAGPDVQKISEYLEEVGGRLALHVKRKGIRYEFHYLDEPSLVNAFALPGGQIFLGRGLLKLLDSEDELAVILGHEIAHVDERHAIEKLQYELQSRKLGLDGLYRLGSFGVRFFQAGYTKDQELDADRAGLELSVAAGYSPGAAIDAMSRMGQLRQQARTQASSPVEELAGVPIQGLQEYFRSHPPEADRIAAFERQILSRGWNRNEPQRPLAIRDHLHAE